MSLPTSANLMTLDYGYNGMPFCSVPAKTGLNLSSMDFGYNGMPFVSNPDGLNSVVKTINGLALASIKSINGLAIASRKSRNGLQ